ncbi:DUF1549 domain-containing protein [Tundrisphaera lichenicola]|uniref:DUF1549 domain-containing protein n=1 Tax=Tundrisphaera lichenicola TaxID=2029860 RepID=UPI003EBFF4FA
MVGASKASERDWIGRTARIAWLAAACPALLVIHRPAAAGDELPGRIDRRIEASCETAGLALAGPADDATFLRRASLDLIGRIPTPAEVRAFLESEAPDRRLRLVAGLVGSPAHARQSAGFWRRAWVPQADSDAMRHVADELDEWLASRLGRRDRIDAIVRDLLGAGQRPVVGAVLRDEEAPAGFLLANESKAENLAGSTARAFLGVNLACAQCHDHPFAPWSRDQFWELAAFFAKPGAAPGLSTPSALIGDPVRRVVARPPDGAELAWPGVLDEATGRKVLAGWLTDPSNPWFARQVVNELWSQFFGLGLVESFDDPTADNPPANLALLDELAGEFAASGFDLERLTTAIVMSRAYQREAVPPADPAGSRRIFASASPRLLSGEQLFDSVRTAAGFASPREGSDADRVRQDRRRFALAFQVARPTSEGRSLLQALTLMNGALIEEATTPGRTPVLVAAESPFFDTADRVQGLFLATLGRPARDAELAPLVAHLDRANAGREASTLADILWALLNSSEFSTNH